MMKKYVGLTCLLIGLISTQYADAQQTIFNVPSADVTPQKQVFLQTEGQTRFFGSDQYYTGTQYGALGIGHNTELDATLFNLSTPSQHNISLGLGFKSAIPLLKTQFPNQEFKVTLGDLVPVSFDGHGVGDWAYTTLSGRLPKIKTRLTVGINYGTKQIFGINQVSFMGGYEQPITKKFSLIGDYYSGSHGSSYFIPGLSYALPKAFAFYLGYQIPDSTKVGKPGLVFEIAKIIN